MSDRATERNYSAFDLELTHQALNVHLFMRLLGWLRPYRLTLFISIFLVVIAAITAVLIPVVTGRVIIDTIMLPNPETGHLPDYGLIAATEWLQGLLNVEALTAAGIIFIGMMLAQAFHRPARCDSAR